MITLGLDLGASRMRAVRRTSDGEAEALGTWLTPPPSELVAMLGQIGGKADRLGVGLAGGLDGAGVINDWPNRPEYLGFDFVTAAATAFAIDPGAVAVIDDCAAAALGEHHAAGGAATSTLYIGVGTGIGAGAVLGGQLHLGANRRAFGIGHLPVRAAADVACRCGRRGCVQAVASGRALGDRARDQGWTGGLLGQAAAAGDLRAQTWIDAAADALAEAIAMPTRLLDPDRVVIGGGVAEAGMWLIDPLMISLVRYGIDLPIELARLGAYGGAIGAVRWAETHLS